MDNGNSHSVMMHVAMEYGVRTNSSLSLRSEVNYKTYNLADSNSEQLSSIGLYFGKGEMDEKQSGICDNNVQ